MAQKKKKVVGELDQQPDTDKKEKFAVKQRDITNTMLGNTYFFHTKGKRYFAHIENGKFFQDKPRFQSEISSYARDNCWGKKDQYISMQTFKRNSFSRKVENVSYICRIGIDFDFETALSKDEKKLHFQNMLAILDKVKFPHPTSFLDSGIGYWMIWEIEDTLSSPYARASFKRINQYLISLFSAFGADSSACDLARYIRVPSSVNSKSDTYVTLELHNGKLYNLKDLVQYSPNMNFDKKATIDKPRNVTVYHMRAEKVAISEDDIERTIDPTVVQEGRAKSLQHQLAGKEGRIAHIRSYHSRLNFCVKTIMRTKGTLKGKREIILFTIANLIVQSQGTRINRKKIWNDTVQRGTSLGIKGTREEWEAWKEKALSCIELRNNLVPNTRGYTYSLDAFYGTLLGDKQLAQEVEGQYQDMKKRQAIKAKEEAKKAKGPKVDEIMNRLEQLLLDGADLNITKLAQALQVSRLTAREKLKKLKKIYVRYLKHPDKHLEPTVDLPLCSHTEGLDDIIDSISSGTQAALVKNVPNLSCTDLEDLPLLTFFSAFLSHFRPKRGANLDECLVLDVEPVEEEFAICD